MKRDIRHTAILLFLAILFLFPGYLLPLKGKKVVSNLLLKIKQLPISKTEMVPMRDNICLATDIYLPQGDGPWPVILVRTLYGKFNNDRKFHEYLLIKGYAIVIQDTRGRGDSEGIDIIFQADGWGLLRDGFDTCSWIVAQSWCNGKIGTMGDSALGVLQCLMAPTQPPGLVCQVIGFAPGDFYDDWAFPGDSQGESWKYWLEMQNGQWLYYTGLNHYPRDHWWDQFNFIKIAPLITTPVLHISGLYDIFKEGTIRRFNAWQKHGRLGAKGNQRLIIGPWTHFEKKGVAGCKNYSDEKTITTLQLKITDFLDFWLKGEKNNLDKEPPVVYWEMMSTDKCKEGKWVNKNYLPEMRNTVFYFHSDKKLLTAPPAYDSSISFNYNPQLPWMLKGGNTLYHSRPGPSDQSDELKKDHHLVFSTPHLLKNLNITGEVQCHLYFKTNVPSIDLVAILVDISPNGEKIILADGIKRMKLSEESCLSIPLIKTEEGVLSRFIENEKILG